HRAIGFYATSIYRGWQCSGLAAMLYQSLLLIICWQLCFCSPAIVSAAAAVAAAKQLSCDFDQYHACQYTLQGWLMEPVENTGILCVIPQRNGYLLYAFTQYPTAHSLHLCLLFNYRLTPERRGCIDGRPRLTVALDSDVNWSLETADIDPSADRGNRNSNRAGWTGSQVSLSVRRNQSRLRIDACGVCLDNLTAYAGRCPIDPAELNWGLRLVAVDPRLWLAPFVGLSCVCLAVGLALSLSLSRHRQQHRSSSSFCPCCSSTSSGEEDAVNAAVPSSTSSAVEEKRRRRQTTPRTPPPPPVPRMSQQRPNSQLPLLPGGPGAGRDDGERSATTTTTAPAAAVGDSPSDNSRVALRLSAHHHQTAAAAAAQLPETSASACGSRCHRPLSIPATCTFVMSAERFGPPTPTQPTSTPTQSPTSGSAPPPAAQRQHSTSLSLSCPGKDLECFRDPDASSSECGDEDDEQTAASRLLGSDAGAPTVPRRFSPTLSSDQQGS
ncbi:hypothetical protein BOX15_Mlig021882g1, partial [Macrostomum lignano]